MEQKLYHFFRRIRQEHYYRVTFVAVFLAAVLAFSFAGLMPGGSRGIFTCDMYGQYYAFLKGLHRMVWEGQAWDYSLSLGFGMGLSGWIAYYLMSPFCLIVLLLPESMLTFGIMLMILLKLAVAGSVFTWFLQKVLKTEGTETIYCGILYAFCGYAVNYYFVIMWLDALILLPVVLYQAKKLADGKKMTGFVLSLSILFLDQYYMAYIIGIFTFAAFTGYCIFHKKQKKTFLRFFAGVLWAFAISAFFMLPTILSMRSRLGTDAADWELFKFSLDPFRFLDQLFLDSYTTVQDGMPLIYCGLSTVLVVPLYFGNRSIPGKERRQAGIALGLLYLVMLFPLTDVLMHIGSRPTWFHYRYSFLFSFVLLILLCRQLSFMKQEKTAEEKKGQKRKLFCTAAAGIGFLLVLYIVVLLLRQNGYPDASDFTDTTGILDMNLRKLLLNAAFLSVLVLVWVKMKKQEERKLVCYLLLVTEVVVHVMTMAGHMEAELGFQIPETIAAYEKTLTEQLVELSGEERTQYRLVKNYHATYNDSIAHGYRGYESFCSVYSDPVSRLLAGMGAWVNWWEYHDLGLTELSSSVFNIGYRLHGKDENYFAAALPAKEQEPYIERLPYAMPVGVFASDALRSVEMKEQDGSYDVVENHKRVLAGFTGNERYQDFVEKLDLKKAECILENVEKQEEKTEEQMTCYRRKDKEKEAYIEYRFTVPAECSAYYYFDVGSLRQPLIITTSMKSGVDSLRLGPQDAQVSYNVQLCEGESPATESPAAESSATESDATESSATESSATESPATESSISEDREVYVRISFGEEQEFCVRNETLFTIDTDRYQEAYRTIMEHPLQVDSMEAGKLTGTITAEQDGLLFVSLPYEEGWTAFVDGTPVSVEPVLADAMLGVPLSAGTHKVTLIYETPGKTAGGILSIAGILLWLAAAAIHPKHLGFWKQSEECRRKK